MNTNLIRLRFKGHELACNPQSFKLTKAKNIIEQASPISGSIVQEFGFNAAVITGSGEFYGDNAALQYDELYSLFKQSGSGILHILGQKPFYAYFAQIGTVNKVSNNAVGYTFKFIQDTKKGGRL